MGACVLVRLVRPSLSCFFWWGPGGRAWVVEIGQPELTVDGYWEMGGILGGTCGHWGAGGWGLGVEKEDRWGGGGIRMRKSKERGKWTWVVEWVWLCSQGE